MQLFGYTAHSFSHVAVQVASLIGGFCYILQERMIPLVIHDIVTDLWELTEGRCAHFAIATNTPLPPQKHNNNNNNNILYLSQREIKAVVRSHNKEHISIILSHETHAHNTLGYMPPFSQSAYTSSKPKIFWNNAFSVKPKSKNSQIKIIRFTRLLWCRHWM